MAGDFIQVDLVRDGIRTRGAVTGRLFNQHLKRTGIRILEDGQILSGAVARAFVRRYGVETAAIGLTGLGTDKEEIASRIENGDTFTVTAYHGVFLEMRETGDFPGVVIELAGLRSCVDFDGKEVRWCAEEMPGVT